MIVLETKDTTVCTRFLLYGGQATCFIDSTHVDRSGWVGSFYPNTQIGGSQSIHTDVIAEAGDTDYVNPLVWKANVTKWINIS